MTLTILIVSVIFRCLCQIYLYSILDFEKELWQFVDAHTEFTNGSDLIINRNHPIRSRDNRPGKGQEAASHK